MANPYQSVGSVATVTSTISDSNFNQGDNESRVAAETFFTTAQIVRRLAYYVKPHVFAFGLSFVCAALSVILQLYVPILTGQGIDLLLGPRAVNFEVLLPLVERLAFVVAGAAVFQWIQGYSINRLTYKVVCDMRIDLYNKLTDLPLSFIDGHAHGDLMSRVVNDVDQVGDGLLHGLTQFFTGVVTIVGTLVFMLVLSVPMAVVVALVTPLSIIVAWAIARFSNSSFATQQRIQGQLGGYIEEMIGNQKLVDAFAYGERAQATFDDINRKLYTAGERAQFLSSLSNPGTRFVNNIIYAVVAVIGCICVITGMPAALTVGQVQTFLSYANQYTKPFNEVTSVISQIQTAFASARRVFALLDATAETPDAPDAKELSEPQGDVVLDHVDFSYVSNRPLLCDITVHAKPGKCFALVGPTGCGKTTIINLLLRFYDVDSGKIKLDGVDTQHIKRASLRRAFGMVLQDSWLFEGTVHDNIAYGRPHATREEVVAAAERAHADSFIRQLPQGYDTIISEDGGTFSQGQRQLLCIARVMLTDPAILLLDEATSSIDTRTELQVQAAFDELMKGRTSFIVAHRLSTIRNADCILVMRDGKIIERGTHDELLERGGAYAELYNAQFSASV